MKGWAAFDPKRTVGECVGLEQEPRCYAARAMSSPTSTKTIGLFAYNAMQAIDLAGPFDVFGTTNSLVADSSPYELCVIGPDTKSVRAENGLTVVPSHAMEGAPPLDTLLIPGGSGAREEVSRNPRVLDWLRQRSGHTRRVVSVCTGAYVLAAAGLLDGRRATTHWHFADDLARRYPALRVEPDRIYLRDGRFATSGGLTAGIDLALALVEEDLGAPTALAVARHLVMYVKRPGNQAQFSMPLEAQTLGTGRMGRLVDWLLAHLHDDVTVGRMAEEVAMSERQFRRVFMETFDTTPAHFVARLRLEQACLRLTQSKASIERIASGVGFQNADTFRRAFHKRYGVTPGEYRERFRR